MAEAQREGQRQNRPFSVTLVALGVLLFGLANGWRALGLVRQSGLLLELGATPDPRLCAAVSAVWAILFVGLAIAIWRRKRYTRLVAPGLLLAFGIYQFVLTNPCVLAGQSHNEWPAIVYIYAVAFVFVLVVLNVGPGRHYYDNQ
jgi:hypothetical protein